MVNGPDDVYVERKGRIEKVLSRSLPRLQQSVFEPTRSI
jgi:CRISPR/Cas system-associated endoribonuclease Cas2